MPIPIPIPIPPPNRAEGRGMCLKCNMPEVNSPGKISNVCPVSMINIISKLLSLIISAIKWHLFLIKEAFIRAALLGMTAGP